MTLFARLSCPTNVPDPPYCSVMRVMSVMRPDTVGIAARTSRETDVAGPVRPELNTASAAVPTTVTASDTPAIFSWKDRSRPMPRLTVMLSWTSGLKPESSAVILYGPPTRIPGMTNRPSPCVTASYFVPDGTWTAVTDAPGTTAPCASRTTPAIDPVVTPWANAEPAQHDRATTNASRITLRVICCIPAPLLRPFNIPGRHPRLPTRPPAQ